MGLRVSREERRQIVSKKSLLALHELINFLKNNVGAEGLFHLRGEAARRRKILAWLRRGDSAALRQLLRRQQAAAVEGAAALQAFLARLRQPLIPTRVQKLVLAENPGVPEGRVASDALGLLAQELPARHLELLAALLDLLHAATRGAGGASELQGPALPLLLLPVFFHLQPADVVRWRRVACTFDEVISTAPAWMRGFERPLRLPTPLLPATPSSLRGSQASSLDSAPAPGGRLEEQQLAVQGVGLQRPPPPGSAAHAASDAPDAVVGAGAGAGAVAPANERLAARLLERQRRRVERSAAPPSSPRQRHRPPPPAPAPPAPLARTAQLA